MRYATKEEIYHRTAKIRELWHSGKNQLEIAGILLIKRSMVTDTLRNKGIKKADVSYINPLINIKRRQEILEYKYLKLRDKDIARLFNITKERVRQIINDAREYNAKIMDKYDTKGR